MTGAVRLRPYMAALAAVLGLAPAGCDWLRGLAAGPGEDAAPKSSHLDLKAMRNQELQLAEADPPLQAIAAELKGIPLDLAGTTVGDYGGFLQSADRYLVASPRTVTQVQQVIAAVVENGASLRTRGQGHSMNGSSLPISGAVSLRTENLDFYHIESTTHILAGSGIPIYGLELMLRQHGAGLPIFPDGSSLGPSVGGYISASGFGGASDRYGGLWANVEEITLVDGIGDVHTFDRDDPEFPWLFGSMGQLGILVSAKLRLRQDTPRSPPAGKQGRLTEPERLLAHSDRPPEGPLVWFNLVTPRADAARGREALLAIQRDYPDTLNYRRPYRYDIPFEEFTPPLFSPVQGDLVAMGIWGFKTARTEYAEIVAMSRRMTALANSDPEWRRYVQTEVVGPGFDYEPYFGAEVHRRFAELKRRFDPHHIFQRGIVFPAPEGTTAKTQAEAAKRRFHIINLSLPKTGSTSLAAIFADYRSYHEWWHVPTVEKIMAFHAGEISGPRLDQLLLERDRLNPMELDSNTFLHMVAPRLVRLFPEAEFVLSVRNAKDWVTSFVAEMVRFAQKSTAVAPIDADDPHVFTQRWANRYGKFYSPHFELADFRDPAHLGSRTDRVVADLVDYWHRRTLETLELMAELPPERRLVYRLKELDEMGPTLAKLAGVPLASLHTGVHRNRGENRDRIEVVLDTDRLAAIAATAQAEVDTALERLER